MHFFEIKRLILLVFILVLVTSSNVSARNRRRYDEKTTEHPTVPPNPCQQQNGECAYAVMCTENQHITSPEAAHFCQNQTSSHNSPSYAWVCCPMGFISF